MKCPNCGSNDVRKVGVTQDWDHAPVYECQACGAHFAK